MPSQPKYNITRMLFRMDGRPQINEMKLAIAVDKDLRTIKNWRAIEYGEKASINVDSMYKIAEFFNCTMEALINKPVEEVAK